LEERSKAEVSADVPTPLFYDGDFFVLNDERKNISRVDPATGNVKWTVELPGRKFEASPTGADGKLYLMNFGADVVVIDAAKGGILGTIAMGTRAMTRRAHPLRLPTGNFSFARTTSCIA
jgi:outer membrane protein assembly factor BamB